MAAKVIDFPLVKVEEPKDDMLVWECPCGCREFWLTTGGQACCTGCLEIKPDVVWAFTNRDQT